MSEDQRARLPELLAQAHRLRLPRRCGPSRVAAMIYGSSVSGTSSARKPSAQEANVYFAKTDTPDQRDEEALRRWKKALAQLKKGP